MAEGDDQDSLPARNVQPGYAKVVEILSLQLGVADLPPHRLREVQRGKVLKNLGDERPKRTEHGPPGVQDLETGGGSDGCDAR